MRSLLLLSCAALAVVAAAGIPALRGPGAASFAELGSKVSTRARAGAQWTGEHGFCEDFDPRRFA